MKDFVKWLGVNEKIAKVVVWVLIIFVMLIIVNAALDSLGFTHYQITYDNLKQIKTDSIIKYLISWITILLNFFTTVLLIFRVKEIKKLFKYSLLYLILNIVIEIAFNYLILQIFIFIFLIVFSYLYSNKNKKYIVYSIISIIINTSIQGLTYYYKARLLNYESLSSITQSLLFVDYVIIMGIIILVKEIYLKKRSEKKWDIVGYGSENSKKKETSQRN